MQPDWLGRYFEQHTHGEGKLVDADGPDDGVSRRDFMKGGVVAGVAASMVAGGVAATAGRAEASNVMGGPWWPSPWGKSDERGANHRVTPAKILQAARLIKKGKAYRFGMVLEAGIPTFGARHVSITIPGAPTGGPFGEHKLMYNDEMFSGEIGQVGSQFDGLGHIGAMWGEEIRYYNGFTQKEVSGSYGLSKLGVHHLQPFFTRGVLVDVLGLKGGERLPIGYVITMDDVQAALRRQGIAEPGEGDAVFFRTGHIKLWMKDNVEFNKGCPGPGLTVAKWLADRKICVVGADNWPVEAVPGEHEDRPFECHVVWIPMNGIFIIENQNLEEIASDKVYEFAWAFNPLPVKGGTGSPGNSFAIA